MRSIDPIPQQYKGYLMRSTTEARYAVVMDVLEIAWEHEPEGYSMGGVWYRPDFILLDSGIFVEIKPYVVDEVELIKPALLASYTGRPILICAGAPGNAKMAVVVADANALVKGFACQSMTQCKCGNVFLVPRMPDAMKHLAPLSGICKGHDFVMKPRAVDIAIGIAKKFRFGHDNPPPGAKGRWSGSTGALNQ